MVHHGSIQCSGVLQYIMMRIMAAPGNCGVAEPGVARPLALACARASCQPAAPPVLALNPHSRALAGPVGASAGHVAHRPAPAGRCAHRPVCAPGPVAPESDQSSADGRRGPLPALADPPFARPRRPRAAARFRRGRDAGLWPRAAAPLRLGCALTFLIGVVDPPARGKELGSTRSPRRHWPSRIGRETCH